MKGFAFTMDALYSVLLISVFLAFTSFTVPQVEDVSVLNKVGLDLLSSLDKSGYFNFFEQSETTINLKLDEILSKLPSNVNGKITLQRYEPQSGSIVLKQTYTRQNTAPLDERVAVARAIPDIDHDKYYLITLEVWHA